MPVFNSISSFRDYLLQIGITQVCKKSTLSEYYGKMSLCVDVFIYLCSRNFYPEFLLSVFSDNVQQSKT